MSRARRRLKSPQSLYSTSTHPTMVTHRSQSWSWIINKRFWREKQVIAAAAETNWKHKVTPDWGDLMNEILDFYLWQAFSQQVLSWFSGSPMSLVSYGTRGWVGLWGFLWWAPSAKRKDHHGVSSGWSSVWHRSNTGLSSTQYEQIPIILGVWPFWLTPFFFSVNNILAGLWLNCITSVEITPFLLADILLQHRALFQC